MKRLVIRWKTDNTADLIFIARAVRALQESGRAFTELHYGEPATKRVTIHQTKAGYSLTVEAIP